MIPAALLVALGYLTGSIPFGVLVARKVKGVDVRDAGSGNIGATNVARVVGKKLGALVLFLDAAKGALPVLLARALLPGDEWLHAAVALGAFLGHVFPVWLRFRGGKGVATAAGVLVVLTPLAALAGVVAYALLFALWRVSSVGSLAGAAVAVAAAFVLDYPSPYAVLSAVMVTLVVFTHRGNIARILRRTERAL